MQLFFKKNIVIQTKKPPHNGDGFSFYIFNYEKFLIQNPHPKRLD